jgi:uncharacterized lipoprotein YmbA
MMDPSRRPNSAAPVLVLGIAAAASVLGGCASQPDPVLLAFASERLGTTQVVRAPDAPVVLVHRITIPEYMSSRRVRYRSDADTLAEWPNTYWAERIETGMTRSFTLALQGAMPGATVCESPCDGLIPTAVVDVDIVQLDFVRSEQRLTTSARTGVSFGATTQRQVFQANWRWAHSARSPNAPGQAEATLAMLRGLARATASWLCGPGADMRAC